MRDLKKLEDDFDRKTIIFLCLSRYEQNNVQDYVGST